MSDVVIAVRGLHHTYLCETPLATVALCGADLQVCRGECAALVGSSGAGKSTLVHFLNGLLRPTMQGQVSILGQDTARPDCDMVALRRAVGLVGQYPHQQLFERYVGDDVAYGPRQLGLPSTAVETRVHQALDAVGLPYAAFAGRLTFSLSGGEMRRAALAGVLAMEPEILVLDEATTGLDPRGRREVHALLRRLRQERELTLIIVSNDMDEVSALAEHVSVLYQGQTVLAGSAREVFAQGKALRAWGLATPIATEAVEALQREGLPIASRAITVAEAEEAIWVAIRRSRGWL
jgi:energy-coupling factor transporter ATP-binding protein EcfA2